MPRALRVPARAFVLAGLIGALGAGPASAAPGVVDGTFGMAGTVALDGGFAADAVFVQADQKIVAVGQSTNNGDIVVERFTAAGALDASYGTAGITRIGSPGATFGGAALAPDGALVITGNGDGHATNGVAPFVTRLAPSGALDTAFGAAGRRTFTNPDGSLSYFSAVTVLPSGGIVLTGTAFASQPPNRLAIARLSSSGTVDTAAGATGIQTLALGVHGDEPWVTAVQPDGKVLVGDTDPVATEDGYLDDGSDIPADTFAVSRYLASGAPDPSFSGDGLATVNLGTGYQHVRSITVSGSGEITATGDFYDFDDDASATTLAVARFSAGGTPDPGFGTAGSELLGIGSDIHNRAGGFDAAGRLLVLGQTYDGGLRVARLLPDGALDATFGGAGVLGIDDLSGEGAAVQSDSALVIGGQTKAGVSLVRVAGGGPLPTMPTPTPTLTPTPTPTNGDTPTPTPAPSGPGTPTSDTTAPVATPKPKSPTATPAVTPIPTLTKPAAIAPAFVAPATIKRTALTKGVLVRLIGLVPSTNVVVVATAGKKRVARLIGKADATGVVRVRVKVSRRALAATHSKSVVLTYRYADATGAVRTATETIAVR